MEPQRIQELQQRYSLTYHVPFAATAQQIVGFAGKRVLEVGGSLPQPLVIDEFGAAQWTAIEEMDYWDETLSTGHVLGTPPKAAAPRRFADASPATLGDHEVLHGRIEHLPKSLEGHYDLVFSIACFEHIGKLQQALERMHAALRPGGRLFSLYSPVWSSHDGHHLPEMEDASGRRFNFSTAPIPPWGHLTMRHDELFDHLLKAGMDRATAQEVVYFVFTSPHINRLLLEDHLALVQRSPFRVIEARPIFPRPVPPEVQAKLEAMYPGRRDFSHNGLLLVLERAAEVS